jgi:hypothetical protein
VNARYEENKQRASPVRRSKQPTSGRRPKSNGKKKPSIAISPAAKKHQPGHQFDFTNKHPEQYKQPSQPSTNKRQSLAEVRRQLKQDQLKQQHSSPGGMFQDFISVEKVETEVRSQQHKHPVSRGEDQPVPYSPPRRHNPKVQDRLTMSQERRASAILFDEDPVPYDSPPADTTVVAATREEEGHDDPSSFKSRVAAFHAQPFDTTSSALNVAPEHPHNKTPRSLEGKKNRPFSVVHSPVQRSRPSSDNNGNRAPEPLGLDVNAFLPPTAHSEDLAQSISRINHNEIRKKVLADSALVSTILNARLSHLRVITQLWRRGNVPGAIMACKKAAQDSSDLSVVREFLSVLCNAKSAQFTLDSACMLTPLLTKMISSRFEADVTSALKCYLLVLQSFAKLVIDTQHAAQINALSIAGEERLGKCTTLAQGLKDGYSALLTAGQQHPSTEILARQVLSLLEPVIDPIG